MRRVEIERGRPTLEEFLVSVKGDQKADLSAWDVYRTTPIEDCPARIISHIHLRVLLFDLDSGLIQLRHLNSVLFFEVVTQIVNACLQGSPSLKLVDLVVH